MTRQKAAGSQKTAGTLSRVEVSFVARLAKPLQKTDSESAKIIQSQRFYDNVSLCRCEHKRPLGHLEKSADEQNHYSCLQNTSQDFQSHQLAPPTPDKDKCNANATYMHSIWILKMKKKLK